MKTAEQIKGYSRKMKRNPTLKELSVMNILDELSIPYKPQLILGFYILDIVLPTKMINIEVDGYIHDNQKKYDISRDKFIRQCGFDVIRIKNEEVDSFDFAVILSLPDKPDKEFKSALGKANSYRSVTIMKQKIKQL